MREIRTSPFKRTAMIEEQIDEFLDKLSEAGLVFEQAVRRYLDVGVDEIVQQRLDQVGELEGRGDELRRGLERVLFTEMLIPDTRGDVLGLLDNLDDLYDGMKDNLELLVIEHPEFPDAFKADLRELTSQVAKSVEETAVASRAYFRSPHAVPDHIHKIALHESEADALALRLSRSIFSSDLPLERKRHLRFCVSRIDSLADQAEDVADRLAIFAVKRSL